MGAVRLLKDKVEDSIWPEMNAWCSELIAERGLHAPLAIGAGGNINRLFKLCGGLNGEALSYDRLASLVEDLSRCSYEERMLRFQLKPDRADVVVPAGRIYLDTMKMVGAEGILVPKVGLADGMILGLYNQVNPA